MSKKRLLLIIFAVAVVIIGILLFSIFHYTLIQGDADDIDFINIEIQLADGDYRELKVTEKEQLNFIYSKIVSASEREKYLVRRFPDHHYTKDSYITFYISYKNGSQTVHIGLDDRIVFDLKPKLGYSEEGFAIIDRSQSIEELKDYAYGLIVHA